MELCRALRWKSFYGQQTWTHEALQAVFEANEVSYSCLCSDQPWGPDDAPVAPERCHGGRACFAPSPRLIPTPPGPQRVA